MGGEIASVRGKVFVHPGTKKIYGTIRPASGSRKFSTLDGKEFDLLAYDDGGNGFTILADGSVWFWDHETDRLEELSRSLPEFIAHCADPSPVELDPKNVKSVWIDPAFAKSRGMKVPKDGWVKKRSEPK